MNSLCYFFPGDAGLVVPDQPENRLSNGEHLGEGDSNRGGEDAVAAMEAAESPQQQASSSPASQREASRRPGSRSSVPQGTYTRRST